MADENSQTLEIDERQELEDLRVEVTRLRFEQVSTQSGNGGDTAKPVRRSRRAWARTAGAVTLIPLAAVLAPLSVVSVWARSQVTDTDRYVETVAPLANDPAVQKAIAADLTNKVFAYVDVQGLTTQAFDALSSKGALPPALATQLGALAVPLSNSVHNFVGDQVLKVVQSDAFANSWVEANRTAHEQLVAALSGKGGTAVQVQDGAVTVDLGPFLDVVKQRLVSSGFQLASRIPAVNAKFTVFESADVDKVQRGYRLLNALGLVLPFVCVLLAGVGIYLARNRRLAFLGAGLGLTAAMLLTGILLALARRAYLNGVPADMLPPDAAAVLYDTLVRFLRDAIRSAALIGVFVAACAFLTGPALAAVTLRRWLNIALAAVKGGLAQLGLNLGPITREVAPRVRIAQVVVLAVAFVVVLLERYRTPEMVIKTAICVLAVLLIVQFLAVTPRGRGPKPDPALDPDLDPELAPAMVPST